MNTESLFGLIGIVLLFVVFNYIRKLYFGYRMYEAVMAVYSILSFEWLFFEDVSDKLKSTKDQDILWLFSLMVKNGNFDNRYDRYKFIYGVSISLLKFDVIELKEEVFNKKWLEENSFLFNKLNHEDKKRYFLAEMCEKIHKDSKAVIDSAKKKNENHTILSNLVADLDKAFQTLQEIETTIFRIRKKPFGKKPPRIKDILKSTKLNGVEGVTEAR